MILLFWSGTLQDAGDLHERIAFSSSKDACIVTATLAEATLQPGHGIISFCIESATQIVGARFKYRLLSDQPDQPDQPYE